MARHSAKAVAGPASALQPLPLSPAHWRAIVRAMGLSPRQAEIAKLMARGASLKEISAILDISVSTIRTQQVRIFAKTGVNGRIGLLMNILEVSHHVGCCGCRHNCRHIQDDAEDAD